MYNHAVIKAQNKNKAAATKVTVCLFILLFTIFCTILCSHPVFAGIKTIPEDKTKINALTYQENVYVTRVYIGPEITDIAEDSFVNLHKLWLIQVDENNPYYSTYGNCLYNKDKTRLICIPFALTRTMLPNTVTQISPYALKGRCDHAKRTILGVIENNAAGNVNNTTQPRQAP